ncbi:MAG TPA: ABC transporter ATP-binding protein [Dehalococcoidia bacterium]|nr:ABC transporter ATP-binding protein [Dehalococcoidia bacterium]
MLEVAIRHRVGEFTLDAAFVSPGGTLAVVGPSGAGKSLTLKAIAGILRPDAGRIVIGGLVVFDGESGLDLPPQLRKVGYVPQEYALFPHLTVDGNIGFGLHAGADRAARIAELLALTGLGRQRGLRPAQLSGGQRQRVALARALAVRPTVLLLDEPFSAVDAPTRITLMEDVARVLADARTPAVLVTHNRDEALRLGDRIAVMMSGRVRQVGSPSEVFSAPVDEDVAAFVGVETVVEGRVRDVVAGLATIAVGQRVVEAGGEVAAGDEVLVCLRPEDVTLGPPAESAPTSARNHLPATVRRVTAAGPWMRVEVDAGFPVVSLVTKQSHQELQLQTGAPVVATFKASAVHLIRKRGR